MKPTLLLLAGVSVLHAPVRAADLEERTESRHHFGASLPVWLKAGAKFTATRATNPGPAAGSAVDRFYDDGYNRVNAAGNPVLPPAGPFAMPRTSFFGYQSDGQVANLPASPAAGGALSMHSGQLNGGDYGRSLDNQPLPGLEFFYRYDWKAGRNWQVSWELAAAYNFFNWEQHGAPNSTVNLLTDVFALGGVVLPPGAPYDGPFTPTPFSPQIGSTPTRTEATVAAAVTGKRRLQLHAMQFRAGPAFQWEPNANWQIGLQGGLALGVGFSQLSFAEQITVADPTVPVISQSGRSSAAHFWAGLFSSLRINRRLGEHWDAHVEIRHLLTDAIHHNGPTRSGEISLSEGFAVATCVSYRF